MRGPEVSAPGAVGTASERGEQEQAASRDSTKTFATLQAQYAMRGWRLIRDGHAFIALRFGRARDLADLDAADRFLTMVGGAQ